MTYTYYYNNIKITNVNQEEFDEIIRQNKEKKYHCDICDCVVSWNSNMAHRKSKKHIKNLNQNDIILQPIIEPEPEPIIEPEPEPIIEPEPEYTHTNTYREKKLQSQRNYKLKRFQCDLCDCNVRLADRIKHTKSHKHIKNLNI